MSRILLALTLVLAIVGALGAAASLPKCTKGAVSVGDSCHIKAYHIKPTQFAYGRVASQCKAQYLESMSSSKLASYLQKDKHSVPLIIGWDGEFYATDHHHLTRALMDSNIPQSDQTMYGHIVADYSNLEELPFWHKMVQKGYVWLFDERSSQPISPFHLSDDMSGLQNDYYRSLSYFVRTYGGFGKTNTSYAEFLWSNWYRMVLPLPFPVHLPTGSTSQASISDSHLADASPDTTWDLCDVFPYETPCLRNETGLILQMLPKALQLASSPAASSLPGYGKGVAEEPNCNIGTLSSRLTRKRPSRP